MIVQFQPPNDGPFNMGEDIPLLERAEQGEPGARVYSWNDVWVTLGQSQRAEDVLLDLSVKHIVRPTGGAAVLHGHDATVGIAMPLALLGCEGREVKKAFLGLTKPVLAALNEVGVPAVLGRDFADRGTQTSPYCFGMKSDYDVLHAKTGEKLCGCAMKVTHSAALLQASIPVTKPSVEPESIIRDYLSTPVSTFDAAEFCQYLEQHISMVAR